MWEKMTRGMFQTSLSRIQEKERNFTQLDELLLLPFPVELELCPARGPTTLRRQYRYQKK